MFETLTYEKKGSIGLVTLNRPHVLNALNSSSFPEISQAFTQANDDDEVRALILTGAGRAFCAGLDLKETTPEARFSRTAKQIQQMISRSHEKALYDIRMLEKPVIAAINGDAIGAGLSLTLLCDFRIASDRARFSTGYLNIALMPGGALTQLLIPCVGKTKATELLLLADMFDAREAERMGLVNRTVEHEELEPAVWQLAERLARGPTVALGLTKLAINRACGDYVTEIERESYEQTVCNLTEDMREAITAYQEKRPPQFKGR